MCITRVGRVLATKQGKAEVEFFDGRTSEGVDVSIVPAGKGAYVEVFGNVVLSTLSPAEARERKAMWREIRMALRKDEQREAT
jgi:hydrogenase maturation factor